MTDLQRRNTSTPPLGPALWPVMAQEHRAARSRAFGKELESGLWESNEGSEDADCSGFISRRARHAFLVYSSARTIWPTA